MIQSSIPVLSNNFKSNIRTAPPYNSKQTQSQTRMLKLPSIVPSLCELSYVNWFPRTVYSLTLWQKQIRKRISSGSSSLLDEDTSYHSFHRLQKLATHKVVSSPNSKASSLISLFQSIEHPTKYTKYTANGMNTLLMSRLRWIWILRLLGWRKNSELSKNRDISVIILDFVVSCGWIAIQGMIQVWSKFQDQWSSEGTSWIGYLFWWKWKTSLREE